MKREKILQAAIRVAIRQANYRVNRDQVAKSARVAAGLVNHYFGPIEGVHNEIVKFAIANDLHKIVAMALLANHPATKELTTAQRREALKHILR